MLQQPCSRAHPWLVVLVRYNVEQPDRSTVKVGAFCRTCDRLDEWPSTKHARGHG